MYLTPSPFQINKINKYTNKKQNKKKCSPGGFLESNVDFPYGNYGRVRIHEREICSDDSSLDGVTSEALCGTKGLKVGVIGK